VIYPAFSVQYSSLLAGPAQKIHLEVSRVSDKLLTADGWIKSSIWNTKWYGSEMKGMSDSGSGDEWTREPSRQKAESPLPS